jgi:hypothetical protein
MPPIFFLCLPKCALFRNAVNGSDVLLVDTHRAWALSIDIIEQPVFNLVWGRQFSENLRQESDTDDHVSSYGQSRHNGILCQQIRSLSVFD